MVLLHETSHFVSFQRACLYYSAYGVPREQVEQKLQAGEITIGAPKVPQTQRVILHPTEGRYFIEDRA
jgi:hypothetical protein